MRTGHHLAARPARRAYDVAVLGKALDVLEELTAATDLGLSELTRRSGTSKAAAFRILSTLKARGYVEQDDRTKRYRAGPSLLAMGSGLVEGRDLTRSARPVLEGLRSACGETVNLGVLEDGHVRYLEVLESPRNLRAAGMTGQRDPLHCTSLGKAILAFLPRAEARRLLARTERRRITPHTIVSIAKILKDLDQIRERGYAIDDQETASGVRCVGAPILDLHRHPCAALSVSGPASRLDKDAMTRLGTQVGAAALEVAKRMGYGVPASGRVARAQRPGPNTTS